MLRTFFASTKPWIKNEVLNYLFNEEYQKTPVRSVRAQVLRFINSEELERNELMSAEIHDSQHYIKCFFANESLDEFKRHSIDCMKGTHIIINDYTISHEIDYSLTNERECFLTIKNFDYTKNTTVEEERYLKYICEEMEVKETLQAKDNKLNHINHPGWNGFRAMFCSDTIDIRTVPLCQSKIMNDIPGWNFSQRNNNIAKIEPSAEWNHGSPELPRHDPDETINLNDEDIAIVMKGNYEEKENYRKNSEVHFERTKRKYADNDPNDIMFSKRHKNSPNSFCSYV